MQDRTRPSRRALIAGIFALLASSACAAPAPRVLVFSQTAAFRHSSIETGVGAIRQLGQEHGFVVEASEDAAAFDEDNLRNYDVVVFLNTTGDVLDGSQQADFERFIQAGGGFVGIHAASDTEYRWPWYGRLVGAYFVSHPIPQEATLRVMDPEHPATRHLAPAWVRFDEWYDLRYTDPGVHVLLAIDEDSYEGAITGPPHAMAWSHEFDGGRAFYTALGHTNESYSEAAFLQHLSGGIEYALGAHDGLDYSRIRRERLPREADFTRTVLDADLTEPMELAVAEDGSVIYVERKGAVKLYDPTDGSITVAARIPPAEDAEGCSGCEDGLMGVAFDPDFATNDHVYLFYSPAGSDAKQLLSRFELRDRRLDLDTEIVMLEIPVQRNVCCHTGGSIAFDADGNLYLSTGDDVSPFESDDFAPIDERPGRAGYDAQGSSANTNDLRGKILRIHPEPDGTYTTPDGNLFARGEPNTRPEIYIMGGRNPFRISVDSHTGFLYWGDVGPDAGEGDIARGPRGHDEINQARAAGFHGWPYFVGDNKPYRNYDFASGESGARFDPQRPLNDSPNNTGRRELPPARPAFIWYPYDRSAEFPQLSSSGNDGERDGRTAMAGPVFYSADYRPAPGTFPPFFDGKLFIYEWMRNWIKVVTLTDDGDLLRIEDFMPSTEFHRPMDLEFGPEGVMYMLEYGYIWHQRNEDARLLRIDYSPGGDR